MSLRRLPYWGFCLAVLVAVGCGKSESSPPASQPAPKTESMMPMTQPASAEPVDEPLVAEAGTTLYQLDVEGMHCQGCADTITKRLKKAAGVKQARVSFNRKTGWVLVEEGSTTSLAGLEQAVADAGYKAKATSVAASWPG